MVTLKQELERKSEQFCSVNFFCSNFKVERENGVFEQKFALLLVVFYSCEAVSRAKLYCGALGFLQFKEFELYWSAVFFLRSVLTFS